MIGSFGTISHTSVDLYSRKEMENAGQTVEMVGDLAKRENEFLRQKRCRMSVEDFQVIKTIGRGAFGIVQVVRQRDTGRVFAMKTLHKSDMLKNDQVSKFLFTYSSSWHILERSEIVLQNRVRHG